MRTLCEMMEGRTLFSLPSVVSQPMFTEPFATHVNVVVHFPAELVSQISVEKARIVIEASNGFDRYAVTFDSATQLPDGAVEGRFAIVNYVKGMFEWYDAGRYDLRYFTGSVYEFIGSIEIDPKRPDAVSPDVLLANMHAAAASMGESGLLLIGGSVPVSLLGSDGGLAYSRTAAVRRFRFDGAVVGIDGSFGEDGRGVVFAPIAPGWSSRAINAFTQHRTAAIVAVTAETAPDIMKTTLRAYTPSGWPDKNFGDGSVFSFGGFVTRPVTHEPLPSEPAVAIQRPDGGFIIAGWTSTLSGDTDATLLAVTPDGRLDTQFNGTGSLVLNLGGDDSIVGLARGNDGAIIAIARRDNAMLACVFDAEGNFLSESRLPNGMAPDDARVPVAVSGDGIYIGDGDRVIRLIRRGSVLNIDHAFARSGAVQIRELAGGDIDSVMISNGGLFVSGTTADQRSVVSSIDVDGRLGETRIFSSQPITAVALPANRDLALHIGDLYRRSLLASSGPSAALVRPAGENLSAIQMLEVESAAPAVSPALRVVPGLVSTRKLRVMIENMGTSTFKERVRLVVTSSAIAPDGVLRTEAVTLKLKPGKVKKLSFRISNQFTASYFNQLISSELKATVSIL